MLGKELRLSRRIDFNGRPRAVVAAADEALRLSLVFLLEMCRVDALAVAAVDELIANFRLDEEFIFIDCKSRACSGIAAIEELRSRGWQGRVVFMTEGEQSSEWNLPDGPTSILVKPFTPEDVLVIIGR